MKKSIFILVFAIVTMATHAQKKMALIEAIPETVIGVNAMPKVVDDSFVFLISQNNVNSFEVTQPFDVNPSQGKLEKDVQYYFILSVQNCEKCESKPAKVLGYVRSTRQNYKDITELNDKFLTNTE